jgi:low affinity Fe/Cu permease
VGGMGFAIVRPVAGYGALEGGAAVRDFFGRVASKASAMAGSYWAFLTASLVILIWGISGPVFGFSDTWQLVINTGTTIVTFLMVFLIQNSQNREARATQLKLDELIRSVDRASDRLIDIEEGSDEELDRLESIFRRRAERVRAKVESSEIETSKAADDLANLAVETAKEADEADVAANAAADAASAVTGGGRRNNQRASD